MIVRNSGFVPTVCMLIKKNGNYFLLVVGTSNKLVIYNLGNNPLINSPTSFQTINTSSLAPALIDPRGIVSKTICDTTVVFISGLSSNSINRLLFTDLALLQSM